MVDLAQVYAGLVHYLRAQEGSSTKQTCSETCRVNILALSARLAEKDRILKEQQLKLERLTGSVEASLRGSLLEEFGEQRNMSLDERIKARKMELIKKSVLSGTNISATTCLTSREGVKDTLFSEGKEKEMMHKISELEDEKMSLEFRLGELEQHVQE